MKIKHLFLLLGLVLSLAGVSQSVTFPQANNLVVLPEENFGKITPSESNIVFLYSPAGGSFWRMLPNDRKTPVGPNIKKHPNGIRYQRLPLTGAGGSGTVGSLSVSQITDLNLIWPPKWSDMQGKPDELNNVGANLALKQNKLLFRRNNSTLGTGTYKVLDFAGTGVTPTTNGDTLKLNFSGGGSPKFFFSPLDYGVDTTGAVDCTVALQTMFNAAAGGGWAVLPKGRYKTTGTIAINANGNELTNLVIQGYGARILSTNAENTPVLLFNDCMRIAVQGLQVGGTIDFDGFYTNTLKDCYFKNLRFGVSNLDDFDEAFWNTFENCEIKELHVYTGNAGGDQTEFNMNNFIGCKIWRGTNAINVYGTGLMQSLNLYHCDISYQSGSKLVVQSQMADAQINIWGYYLDDFTGFPEDTKGIVINTIGTGSVPNSANVGNFVLEQASRSTVRSTSGVRQGSRDPHSGYNLLFNGDIQYGKSDIASDWNSVAVIGGAGVHGQYLRFAASGGLKQADWKSIPAPFDGYYSVSIIARNKSGTAYQFASVVNDTIKLYKPVDASHRSKFVVSQGTVFMRQGDVYKLRLFSAGTGSDTVDVAYAGLSWGNIAQLYLPTHPKAVGSPNDDNTTNLFEKGDGGTLSPDITATGGAATISSSAIEDQTGDGTYILFNPPSVADYPDIRFTLKSRYLKSAIRAGYVTFTCRAKVTSGYGNFLVNFGGSDIYINPGTTAAGSWQDWRVTVPVPSNATTVYFQVTGAATSVAKSISFDGIQINPGKKAVPWSMSPHDAGGGGGSTSITGLVTVANVAALKAITTATNGQVVATTGYYAAFDQGHGTYVWSSTSTATADNGAVIQATGVTTGRWLLQYVNEINARQYGAKADNTTDDLIPLQNGIDYCVTQGIDFFLNGLIFKITNPLRIGTASPASLPSGENFTLRGIAPSFNWLATHTIFTNGTLIRLVGTGKTAIIDIKAGMGRYLRMQDFTVSCDTEGGAMYGIYWSQTAHSEHLLERVHSYRANIAFGIERGGFANGEFITLRKCVGRGVTHFWKMGTDTGQSFNHLLDHCHGSVNDGGILFEFGGSNLGFGFTAIEFESSNAINFASSTGVTFIKNNGFSGIVNFLGGRIEGVSTMIWNVMGSQNQDGKINITGLHSDGTGSSAARVFMKSTSSNSRQAITFDKCIFSPIDPAVEVNIQLGSTDNTAYIFRNCDFTTIKSYKHQLSEAINGKIVYDDCQRTNLSVAGVVRFSKNFAYNDIPATKVLSKPQNLLLQSGFSASTGTSVTATSPWAHGGSSSSFYALYNYSSHLGSYTSSDTKFRQAVLSTTSNVYQTITAAPFNTGNNLYYYSALVSYHAAGGMSLRVSLINSSTNTVYDQVTIKGSSDQGAVLPITLTANDSNVGGYLQLKFENLDAGNPFYLNVYQQHVYTNPMASYVETTTATVDTPWASTGSGGGVSSVAMSVPPFLTISGSPITTSGTLAVTYSGTALPVANGGTNATSASGARTSLGLEIGTDVQAYDSDLSTIASLTATTGNFIYAVGSAWASRTPSQVKVTLSLDNVENTAISTWAGSANITTLGTIGTGTWNATAIADGKIASALTGKTYNGLTLTSTTGTFTLASSKVFVVSNTLTFTGTDGSTLNIGTGGTLGTGAFATISSYATLANPTFTGTPAAPTASAGTNTTQLATTAFVTNAVSHVLESIVIAASDETTAITAGTGKVTFRMPYAMTVTGVRISLTTAQTSGSIFTVVIKESGSTILSTNLTLDNTEKTSTTAATAAVISDTSLADDAEITVDVSQVGDGTGKGLKVTINGYRQ